MTVIFVDNQKWNSWVADNPISVRELITKLENPFLDEVNIIFEALNAVSIITLIFIEGELKGRVVVVDSTNGVKIKFDFENIPEINRRLKSVDATFSEREAAAARHLGAALAVLHRINHIGAFFDKAQRSKRRRFQKKWEELPKTDKYFILDLEEKKRCKPNEGSNSTEIKQRYHLRRGHYRNQPIKDSVKQIWIKPYFAGDTDIGIINKDYRIAV